MRVDPLTAVSAAPVPDWGPIILSEGFAVTSVIARQFGQRIVILSDTQITQTNEKAHNLIPGRLKAITLGPLFSVAYDGHSDPALMAIREARNSLRLVGTEAAIEVLRACSARNDVDVSFLVATHGPASLRRIKNGNVSEPGQGFAIGDTAMNAMVNDRMEQLRPTFSGVAGDPEFGTVDEMLFVSSFSQLLSEGATSGLNGVGGLPIRLLASPYGHSYCGSGEARRWDVVTIGVLPTPEAEAARASGQTEFRFNIVESQFRGVGIAGIVLPQLGVGWMHDPIHHDDAIRYSLDWTPGTDGSYGPMLDHMTTLLKSAAEQFGGGFPESSLPS
jgi:hypothetical protein